MIIRKQREILRLERAMAEARETIARQGAIITAVTEERNALRDKLSEAALRDLNRSPKILFESSIERSGADMAIFDERANGRMLMHGVIDQALTVEVAVIGPMAWLMIVDDLRVIMGAPSSSLDGLTKIGEMMVEEAYERVGSMEGDDEEVLYRALSDASQEVEIKVWAQTAHDCGDLEGEIL